MKVTLRKKKGKKATSLYLDIYHNGNREYDYLNIKLYNKPSKPSERTHNKETLMLAESIAAKRQLELQSKLYGFQNPESKKASFIDYFKKLAENRRNSSGNYGNWLAAIKHFESFSKRDMSFAEISPKQINQYKYYLENEASKKNGDPITTNTASSYFNKLKAALKQATIDEVINENPARNIKGIKETVTQIEFLDEQEVISLKPIPCSVPIIKSAFLFACYTGLRFSDLRKLTWSEIQESNGKLIIKFIQQKTTVPISNPLQGKALEILGKRKNPEELVFTDLKYSDTNNNRLREWISDAGITRHITFHVSRHTFATLALTKGADIYTVKELLGHDSVKTTERYTRVVNALKEEAVNRLNF